MFYFDIVFDLAIFSLEKKRIKSHIIRSLPSRRFRLCIISSVCFRLLVYFKFNLLCFFSNTFFCICSDLHLFSLSNVFILFLLLSIYLPSTSFYVYIAWNYLCVFFISFFIFSPIFHILFNALLMFFVFHVAFDFDSFSIARNLILLSILLVFICFQIDFIIFFSLTIPFISSLRKYLYVCVVFFSMSRQLIQKTKLKWIVFHGKFD